MMDRGAELPDHEHVLLEQTYMIDGRLVDKGGAEKGLAAGPGEVIWRPAASGQRAAGIRPGRPWGH
jgi:anti-sigma factor ChrR (cupin superfamily)